MDAVGHISIQFTHVPRFFSSLRIGPEKKGESPGIIGKMIGWASIICVAKFSKCMPSR